MAKGEKKRTILYSNVKENKKRAEKMAQIRNEQIDLSNEFIIGLNDLPSDISSKKQNNSNKNNPNIKKSNNKNNSKKNNKSNFKNNNKSGKKVVHKNNKKVKKKMSNKIKKRIIAFFSLLIILVILIVGSIIFFNSSFFYLNQITVKIENNNVITESTIKNLSGISVGQNIFSVNKKNVIKNIKEYSYVDEVKVKKQFPNKVEIYVKERSTKFQFEKEGKYTYIDNQGYILEENINSEDYITISGYKTENLVPGNRLDEDDLERLSDVFKILQEFENNDMQDLISSIDIENKNDYLIYLDSVGKIIHFGDVSSINDKMTYINKILEIESEYEGEIFVNVDLNSGEYPYFREKV